VLRARREAPLMVWMTEFEVSLFLRRWLSPVLSGLPKSSQSARLWRRFITWLSADVPVNVIHSRRLEDKELQLRRCGLVENIRPLRAAFE
jgi:hypothetical protein